MWIFPRLNIATLLHTQKLYHLPGMWVSHLKVLILDKILSLLTHDRDSNTCHKHSHWGKMKSEIETLSIVKHNTNIKRYYIPNTQISGNKRLYWIFLVLSQGNN